MRSITNAQLLYSSSCAAGGYATNLATLGVPPPGSTTGYLAPDLASAAVVQKSGYLFQLAPSAGALAASNDCNGTATQTGYYARSEPVTFGMTGNRSFATISPTNVIWQDYTAVAPAEPLGAPAVPAQ
jgi:hypothetical protein